MISLTRYRSLSHRSRPSQVLCPACTVRMRINVCNVMIVMTVIILGRCLKHSGTTFWSINRDDPNIQKKVQETINFLTKGCSCQKGRCEGMRCGCHKMEMHMVRVVDVKLHQCSSSQSRATHRKC